MNRSKLKTKIYILKKFLVDGGTRNWYSKLYQCNLINDKILSFMHLE